MLWVIFAHFLADWSLQPEWVAHNKGKYWFIMCAHCAVWTGCVCVALQYTGRLNIPVIQTGFLFFSHFAMDQWKCNAYNKKPFCQQISHKHLYVDQAFHIVQCIMVYLMG